MSKRNVLMVFSNRIADDLVSYGFKIEKIENDYKRKGRFVYYFDKDASCNKNIDVIFSRIKSKYYSWE